MGEAIITINYINHLSLPLRPLPIGISYWVNVPKTKIGKATLISSALMRDRTTNLRLKKVTISLIIV